MPQHTSAQHQLSDFLHAELLHTLGAYQLASDKLDGLLESVGDTRADTALREVVSVAQRCNEHLRDRLHRPTATDADPAERRRHPSPLDDPPGEPSTELLLPVRDFYDTAAAALRLHLDVIDGNVESPDAAGQTLGRCLAEVHDPQRRSSKAPAKSLVEGRYDRTLHRLDEVNKHLPESLRSSERKTGPPRRSGDARQFHGILVDHMGVRDSYNSLHLTILEAMSDAHMWMHHAEHLRSQNFGTMLTSIPKTHAAMQQALRRSIVLNTFAYVAARSAPWVFAENEDERAHVVKNYKQCCDTLTPTYCMWISNQLSLLALQRRAYTWWTMGKRDRAYRDFYKLTRFLRGLRHQVEQRAVRVPGTKTLIEGLTATAEHHIGRIYRGQHAHRVALRYFDRASLHLKGWEKHPEIGHILRNSRWRLNLLISQGKANYELGKVKKSLLYYARAWRAFLLLAESESHSTANVDVVNAVIKWLSSVEDDPELSKLELSHRLEPLVRQFETVYSPVHLRLLAADIMMRLGHLLFILKLPPSDWNLMEDEDPGELPPKSNHELARRCMYQAAALDQTSTLIAADLLKIRHGSRGRRRRGSRQIPEEPVKPLLREQWPSGGGRFEEAARIIEYILQTWLVSAEGRAAKDGDPEWPDKAGIARELLGSFLAHTDSSNVKLAQVYRYLMQDPRDPGRDTETTSPTIDLVCLRRYSSFFPFLPRPAAFPALGGGYLVQVSDGGPDAEPFGIAIDPGPNFLDNLYRCGYSLADIQMIVLTHDHADHMASVDALLALLGTRMMLGDKTFGKKKTETEAEKKTCLAIVGNKSVVERYQFFNDGHPMRIDPKTGDKAERPDFVRVLSFDQLHAISKRRGRDRRRAINKAEILLEPRTLSLEPVKTVDHFDATGYVSQGFLLSVGDGQNRSSVLFTGDTGPPPARQGTGHHFAAGALSLKSAAAAADVVVAHLSSVPLRELRELADLKPGKSGKDDLSESFAELWEEAVAQAESDGGGEEKNGIKDTQFLLQQLQFGFRASAKKRGDLSVSPLSPIKDIKGQSEKHLYLTGLLELAKHMARHRQKRPPVLLIGELREELGTFRTRIASHVTEAIFKNAPSGGEARHDGTGTALTTDIGLRVRVGQLGADGGEDQRVKILCTTCDLDNDLIATERFHSPDHIREVCVKGENEGVFYNCPLHDPGQQLDQLWVESVERYDIFGD